MKKTITLFYLLLSFVAANAQVTVFQSGVSRYWLTFMMQNNRPSGDLLYSKSVQQPTSGVNSFNVTIGRYNMTTATETMTITLRGLEGAVYNWGSNFSFGMHGLATDNAGNLYVTGYGNKKIYRFNAPSQTSGNVILDPVASYSIPNGGGQSLAIDGYGNLYIGDGGVNIYRVLAADLTTTTSLTTPYLTVSSGVYDIDFDGPGNMYVSTGGTTILKYSTSKVLLSTISYSGSGTNIFSSVIASNGAVFFTTGNNNAIAKYDPVANSTSVFAGASGIAGDAVDASTNAPYTNARFQRVVNLALGGNGVLLAFDENTAKVTRIVANVIEAALPLLLTNFNVSVNANAANYKWTMLSQTDVKKYHVQGSTDGKTFNDIATVLPIEGKLNYTYSDPLFKSGSYVRLKVAYGNGEEEFSDVQFIQNKLEKNQFQASLTSNKLTIKNEVAGNYTIKIVGLDGRVLFSKAQFLDKGSNFFGIEQGLVKAANIYIINCVGNYQNNSIKTIAN